MPARARLAVLLLLLAPVPALAHEFWLAPSHYRAARGEAVEVAAFVGTGFRGERKPYAAPRAMRFVRREGKDQDLRRDAVNGDLTMARFKVGDAGGTLVAYESDFAAIELPAAEFDAYLALEGLAGPLAIRRGLGAQEGPGRERYARCPKTWIAGSDAKRVTRAVGLPLEIVPLDDPTVVSPLRVQVLFHGKPLEGAMVRAWRRPLGNADTPRDAALRDSVGVALETRTGAGGIATLAVPDGSAEWMLSSVNMRPCTNRAIADWESWWASLTFARFGAPR